MAEDFPGKKVFEKGSKGKPSEKHKDWKKTKKEGGSSSWSELLVFPALIFGEFLKQLFG